MASRVTHNTGIALAGAAAVAAAVSAGVSGAGIAEATALAVQAARVAAGRGHWVAGADVAARIEWATSLVAGRGEAEAAELIYTLVGTSLATQESVPAAFAVLAAVPGDPWRACLLAASLGGDCDTIAAMAGAVAGACYGVAAFPADAIATIDGHGLDWAPWPAIYTHCAHALIISLPFPTSPTLFRPHLPIPPDPPLLKGFPLPTRGLPGAHGATTCSLSSTLKPLTVPWGRKPHSLGLSPYPLPMVASPPPPAFSPRRDDMTSSTISLLYPEPR